MIKTDLMEVFLGIFYVKSKNQEKNAMKPDRYLVRYEGGKFRLLCRSAKIGLKSKIVAKSFTFVNYNPMKFKDMIKIAVVGPESTGKSWMTEKLASHYGTLFVPEYAREYCKDLNRQYTLEDEVNIFRGQVRLEDSLMEKSEKDLLFCDTMILTVKIWCDHLFGGTPGEITREIRSRHYDLFLLMDIDLPWQEDSLRDFPHLRHHFMDIWHRELTSLSARYQVISGTGEDRFLNARQVCDELLGSSLTSLTL